MVSSKESKRAHRQIDLYHILVPPKSMFKMLHGQCPWNVGTYWFSEGFGFRALTRHSVAQQTARLGIGVTVLSIFAGALNMVLAGVMGTSLKLNPLGGPVFF